MTDDTTPGIRPLTHTEVGEYLAKTLTASDYICTICKTGKAFTLAYNADRDGHIVPYQLVSSLRPTHTFAAVPLVCENCGHVEFFAHKVIGDKLAEPT